MLSTRVLRAFRRSALLASLLILFGLLQSTARAEVTLTLDLKAGDKVSDTAKIVAHAESGENIDKVEFYVDDQLRYTGTSVPYVFSWNTIADTEGAHTLAVTAFDGAGQTKKVSLAVNIDNELGLGAAALAQKSADARKAGDEEAAMRYARRALKAEPNNTAASRVVAGSFAAALDWDHAISSLEGAKTLDQDPGALAELAVYRTRRAFMPENVANFFPELEAIYSLRQKSAKLAVAASRQAAALLKGAEAFQSVGDALLEAGRYADSQQEYTRCAQEDQGPVPCVNRLALANIMLDLPASAILNLGTVIKAGHADAATRAVYGLALLRSQRFDEARAAVAADLGGDTPASNVVAAYADASLGHPREAFAEANAAARLLPESGDVQFALSMSVTKLTDQAEALNRALSLEPFQLGIYLDYAARTAATTQQGRYERAMKFVDFALARDPNNLNAKIMQALLLMQTKRDREAGPLLDALSRHNKNAADLKMALAIYFFNAGNSSLTDRELTEARKLDPVRFASSDPKTPLELLYQLNRKYHYRTGFFLTPASLYPPVAPTPPTAVPAAP